MHYDQGKNIVAALCKKWKRQNLVSNILLTIGISIVLSVVAVKFLQLGFFIIPVVFAAIFFTLKFLFANTFTNRDVIQFLNNSVPGLEESAKLLMKPYANLNTLEKLQVKKISAHLHRDVAAPLVIIRNVRRSIIVLMLALVTSVALLLFPSSTFRSGALNRLETKTGVAAIIETKPVNVKGVIIEITPPPYTRKNKRAQEQFNIVAEQEATVAWNISTSLTVNEVDLLFNDKSILHLQSQDKNKTRWRGGKRLINSGFYRVRIAGKLSEFYQVEIAKDQPPVIVVQSPKPNTLIQYEQPHKVLVNVSLTDDYGLDNVFINATTASGSGEAVKFKEQQIPFATFLKGNRQYQLQKMLNLAALEMQPGDELYFYIDATDNHQQKKRSDVFIVRLEDTTQLMSMEGLVSGVDLKPEFFRSQRQIIIETEQLLKDRSALSIEDFNKKSNDLGVDQKLLRLRYGKFLGEESETEIGGQDDHDEDSHTESKSQGAANILDQFSHKHDIAEDATFFDAKTKKQLLATLSEMWKAELQLRTLKPKDALPFEYKALRLLKDLQQQTRAYVGKTGSKTTPLKPEIRLTGDLSKVTQPVINKNFEQKTDVANTLRKALGILELVKNKEVLPKTAIETLDKGGVQLSAKAASQPSVYLASYEALRRIQRGSTRPADVDLAARGFQKLVGIATPVPQQLKNAPNMKMSEIYFRNLKGKND